MARVYRAAVSQVFLFIRLCLSPRGAAHSLLRWLACALLPAWLCVALGAGESSAAAAVVRDAQQLAEDALVTEDTVIILSEEVIASRAEPASAVAAPAARDVAAPAAAPSAAFPDALAPDARDVGAPMCDPHGASVAALPEVPEIDHGKLDQLPCDDAWRLWLGASLEQQVRGQASARDGVPASPPPELQVERSRVDGVLPLVSVLPARAEPVQLPHSEFIGLPARSGHRLSIYRPPLYC